MYRLEPLTVEYLSDLSFRLLQTQDFMQVQLILAQIRRDFETALIKSDKQNLSVIVATFIHTEFYHQHAFRFTSILGNYVLYHSALYDPRSAKTAFLYFCHRLSAMSLSSLKQAILLEESAQNHALPLKACRADEMVLVRYAFLLQETYPDQLSQAFCCSKIDQIMHDAQLAQADLFTSEPSPIGRQAKNDMSLIKRWMRPADFLAFNVQPLLITQNHRLNLCKSKFIYHTVDSSFQSYLNQFDVNAILYFYLCLMIGYTPKGNIRLPSDTIRPPDKKTQLKVMHVINLILTREDLRLEAAEFFNKIDLPEQIKDIEDFGKKIIIGYIAQLSKQAKTWLLCHMLDEDADIKNYYFSFGDILIPRLAPDCHLIAKLLLIQHATKTNFIVELLEEDLGLSCAILTQLFAQSLVSAEEIATLAAFDVLDNNQSLMIVLGLIGNLTPTARAWLRASIKHGVFDFTGLSAFERSTLLPICLHILLRPAQYMQEKNAHLLGDDFRVDYIKFNNTLIEGHNLLLLKQFLALSESLPMLLLDNCGLKSDFMVYLIRHAKLNCTDIPVFSLLHNSLEVAPIPQLNQDAIDRLSHEQLFFMFHLLRIRGDLNTTKSIGIELMHRFKKCNQNLMNPMHVWLLACIAQEKLLSGVPYANRELGPYQIDKRSHKELLLMAISVYCHSDLETRNNTIALLSDQSDLCDIGEIAPNDLTKMDFSELEFDSLLMWKILGLLCHQYDPLTALRLGGTTSSMIGLPAILLGLRSRKQFKLSLDGETLSEASVFHIDNLMQAENDVVIKLGHVTDFNDRVLSVTLRSSSLFNRQSDVPVVNQQQKTLFFDYDARKDKYVEHDDHRQCAALKQHKKFALTK